MTIAKLIDRFKPQKVYSIKRFKNAFIWRISSNDNFESHILEDYCKKNDIQYETIPFYPQKFKPHFIYRSKEIVKRFKFYYLDKSQQPNRKIYKSDRVSPNDNNKPIILLYLFGYMYYRNQIIWKYFNDDKDYYYLFITDRLNSSDKNEIEKSI